MDETFGTALRRLRKTAGLSQTKLARLVHLSQSNLSRLELDEQTPDEHTAQLLDEQLGGRGTLLELRPTVDVSPLDADQRARIAYSVKYPGRIDAAAIAALGASLAAHRRLDDVVGPQPLLPATLAETALVTGLLREVGGPHRDELARVAAEHVQFTGWLHAEARNDREAVQWLGDAEDLADEADDGTLAAQASNFKGYLARQQGRPRAMVRWFLGAYHTPGAHVAQRIGDAIQAAQGYARLGEHESALRLLDSAEGMLDEAGRHGAPRTAYWLTPTFHRLNSGLAHNALGDYRTAVDHLQTGLDNLPADQQRAEWTAEYRAGLDEAKAAS